MVEKKGRHVATKGAGVGQPKRGEKKKRGGEAPGGPPVCVSHPKQVEKGLVVGNLKGGGAQVGGIRQWRGTIHGGSTFVLCHRGDSHSAVAKRHSSGGRSNIASPPPPPHTGGRGGQPSSNPETSKGRGTARYPVRTRGAR